VGETAASASDQQPVESKDDVGNARAGVGDALPETLKNIKKSHVA